MPRRTRPRSYPASVGELKEQDNARAVAAAEAAAALVPKPPLDQQFSEEGVEKRITFPTQVRFHSAVRQEDNVELYKLLELNGNILDVNATNHQKMTPLHQAVANRNLDTVKILLCHGADCNIQDIRGHSPLHAAAASGFKQAVSLMILFGANLSLLTNDRLLPADVAKDTTTTNMLMKEMCRQIQHELFMDKYGFIFRGIEQWQRFSSFCCEVIFITWSTLKSFALDIYNRAKDDGGGDNT
ncbi:hypothetical protein BSL78_10618 [Apostichopus japonicus]|uniref:Uncharacterized protein n=1 Tax=Stichopus japonicus TaxID=307972 RepID=A0A2G8KX82_STIJA|nr:hypothetical protein BSL78_10618 [Apostichopus japonicus]